MNMPKVNMPQLPSLPELESVVDHAAASSAIIRRAFVQRFFAEMLARRMNCKTDGIIQRVFCETVEQFADAYRNAIIIPPDHQWGGEIYLTSAAEWLKNGHLLAVDTAEIVNETLAAMIVEIKIENEAMRFNELFEVIDNEIPIITTNRWIDHLKILVELGLANDFVAEIRRLTILANAHDLLIARVGRNTWE